MAGNRRAGHSPRAKRAGCCRQEQILSTRAKRFRATTGKRRRLKKIRVIGATENLSTKTSPVTSWHRSDSSGALDLDHVEVGFWRPAGRADPSSRNVGPPCTRRKAFDRIAQSFVIEVAARPALPDLEITHPAISAAPKAEFLHPSRGRRNMRTQRQRITVQMLWGVTAA